LSILHLDFFSIWDTLQDLDIRLKWPNDIYAGRSAKLGGLIVNTTVESTLAVCNIGKLSYAH